jgi:cell volume regulation protein A
LLATYLAGIVMANRNIPYRPTVNRVYATLAWSSQIVMFFILGLLVTPSMLTANEGELLIGGTLLALWVAFVARPVVVGSILCLFRVPWRHNLLICWGGLRGAVPIILSTIPILAISQVRYANIQESPLPRLFTVVFMAVIVGAMVPGALVRPLTRLLGMDDGRVREPMVEIDFVAQKDIGHLYTTFLVPQNSPADGCTLRELALPQEASILMVLRGTEFIAPRGNVVIEAEDHVMVVYKPEMTNDITAMFAGKPPRARRPS